MKAKLPTLTDGSYVELAAAASDRFTSNYRKGIVEMAATQADIRRYSCVRMYDVPEISE